MTIQKTEVEVSFKQLAQQAGISVSEARKAVKDLEANGLVRLHPIPLGVRMTFIEPKSGQDLYNVFDEDGQQVGMVTKKGNTLTDVPCVLVAVEQAR